MADFTKRYLLLHVLKVGYTQLEIEKSWDRVAQSGVNGMRGGDTLFLFQKQTSRCLGKKHP